MKTIFSTYNKLYSLYGPQGWWPIEGKYHKNNFLYPKNENQKFEICIGAILTQNTSWKNVEKALQKMHENNLIDAKKISRINDNKLARVIISSGYHNQKAKKLKMFAKFYLSLKNKTPLRSELLEIWGIGPETADSILLYAYNYPTFVIDAYTKRIFKMNNKS